MQKWAPKSSKLTPLAAAATVAKISWNVDSVPLLGRKAHLNSQISAQTESSLHTRYIYCLSCMLCTLILCFTMPIYVNLEVGEHNCSQSFVSMPQIFFSICTITHSIPKVGQFCIARATLVTLPIYNQERANRLSPNLVNHITRLWKRLWMLVTIYNYHTTTPICTA